MTLVLICLGLFAYLVIGAYFALAAVAATMSDEPEWWTNVLIFLLPVLWPLLFICIPFYMFRK